MPSKSARAEAAEAAVAVAAVHLEDLAQAVLRRVVHHPGEPRREELHLEELHQEALHPVALRLEALRQEAFRPVARAVLVRQHRARMAVVSIPVDQAQHTPLVHDLRVASRLGSFHFSLSDSFLDCGSMVHMHIRTAIHTT